MIGRRLVLKGLEIWPSNVALDTIDSTAGGSQSAAQQRILEEEGGVAAISLLLELSGCNILGFRDRRDVECKEKKSSHHESWQSTGDSAFHTSDLHSISRTDADNMNQKDEEEEQHVKDLRDWMEEVVLSDDEEMDSSNASSIEDVTENDLVNWNNSEIEKDNGEQLQELKSSFGVVFQQSDFQAAGALPWWETPFLGLKFGSERPTSFPRNDLVLQSGKKHINDVLFPCQFLGAWIAPRLQETSMMQVLPECEFVFSALEMLRGVGGQIFCFSDTSDAPNTPNVSLFLTREAQGWAVAHLTPTCLRDLLEQLAKIGKKFQLVRIFCEEVFNHTNESLCDVSVYDVKYGRVVCAFSAGLEILLGQLDDWLGLLATNLYKQKRGIVKSTIPPPTADRSSRAVVELKNDPRTLTLLRLLNVLTPWNSVISIVLDVMRRGVGWRTATTGPESLQQPTIRLTAAHLLNVLYEESELNDMHSPAAACEGGGSTTECPVEEERWYAASPPEGWLLWLFCTSVAPYLRLLDEWVLSGIADDPHGELFFEAVSANAAANSTNLQGGEVVDRQDQLHPPKSSKEREIVPYTNIAIRKDCIPCFLASVANNIVLTGYSTSLLSRIRVICGRNGQSDKYRSSQMGVQMEPFLENGLMEMSRHVLMRKMHTDKPGLRQRAAAANRTTNGNDQHQPSGFSNIVFQFQPFNSVTQDAASPKNDVENSTLPFPPLPTTATLNNLTVNPLLSHRFTSITGVIMPSCPYRDDNNVASKAEADNDEERQVVPSPRSDFQLQLGGSKNIPLQEALKICLLYKLSIASIHVGKACCNAMLKDLGMLHVMRCLRGVYLLGEPQLMDRYVRGIFSAFGRLTFVNGWEKDDEAGLERFGACGHPDPLSFLKDATHMTWLLHRSFSFSAADENQEGMSSTESCISILEKPLVGGVTPFSKFFTIETAFPGCSSSSSLVTIRSISLVGLTCHLPWPYKIITSPSAIRMYNKVHRLLVQVSYAKHAITCLQGKWKEEWRVGVTVNRTAALQLFAMAYFVCSVHSHLLTQAVGSKWSTNLEADLLDASSLADIIAAHDVFLNNLTYRCLLHRKHKPALNYLLDILQSCISFVEFNFRGGQMVMGGGQAASDHFNDHFKGSQQAYESFIRNCCFFVALLEQVISVQCMRCMMLSPHFHFIIPNPLLFIHCSFPVMQIPMIWHKIFFHAFVVMISTEGFREGKNRRMDGGE